MMFFEICSFATFIGFILLLNNWRELYPKLNTYQKIGFMLLCLGTLVPIFYKILI